MKKKIELKRCPRCGIQFKGLICPNCPLNEFEKSKEFGKGFNQGFDYAIKRTIGIINRVKKYNPKEFTQRLKELKGKGI